MSSPRVLIFAGYGINSEEETKFAFDQAGAQSDIIHINDLIESPQKLQDYQITVFPGGFSYGDDTGGGNAYANKVKNNLWDDILKFIKRDTLTVGICNGCQIVANIGLVPGFNKEYGKREVVFNYNKTARLQCRHIYMKSTSKKCPITKDLEIFQAPIAHGEGNFYAEPEVIKKLKENDQIIFRYVKEDGSPASGEFPTNPNGAIDDIAGICDETGRIMAFMPHPERNLFFTSGNNWTLQKELLKRQGKPLPKEGEGMAIFKKAASYFK